MKTKPDTVARIVVDTFGLIAGGIVLASLCQLAFQCGVLAIDRARAAEYAAPCNYSSDPDTGDGHYLVIFADSTYAECWGAENFAELMNCLATNEPGAVIVSAGTVADVWFFTPGWWDRWFHKTLAQHNTSCTTVAGAEGRGVR